jgi:hypothetical protein
MVVFAGIGALTAFTMLLGVQVSIQQQTTPAQKITMQIGVAINLIPIAQFYN